MSQLTEEQLRAIERAIEALPRFARDLPLDALLGLVERYRELSASWEELFNAEERAREECAAAELRADEFQDQVIKLSAEALQTADTLTRARIALGAAADEIERLKAELAARAPTRH